MDAMPNPVNMMMGWLIIIPIIPMDTQLNMAIRTSSRCGLLGVLMTSVSQIDSSSSEHVHVESVSGMTCQISDSLVSITWYPWCKSFTKGA